MKRSRFLLLAIVVLTAAAVPIIAAGCGDETTTGAAGGGSAGGSIQIKGSDTMVNLAQKWAEDYMTEHPEISIAVTGGGSGTGISAMINGTADVANASRQMKDKEKDEAAANGINVVENKVGLDGIAVIVNPENNLTELSMSQLKDIFTGKTTDWSAVGGGSGNIVILSRESNSGTHVFFKEHVLKDEEYASAALLMPSSQAIVDEVKQNPNAIGYVGLGYAGPDSGVKALMVSGDSGKAVAPSIATVQSGEYPVARPLFMYTKTNSPQFIQDYLAWILGTQGQAIVEELDFVPLS